MTQTVLYARVSTLNQNSAHQLTHAEAAGFKIDRVIADDGVSGVSTRLADRPEGKRLFDILRPGDTLVVRWVDRLGRNYQDVTDTIRDFMRQGVVIRTVINDMTFDGATTDPMKQAVRDALIGFMAATAQAQAEATKEGRHSGAEGRPDEVSRQEAKLRPGCADHRTGHALHRGRNLGNRPRSEAEPSDCHSYQAGHLHGRSGP